MMLGYVILSRSSFAPHAASRGVTCGRILGARGPAGVPH
jgi:hypothetical protein